MFHYTVKSQIRDLQLCGCKIHLLNVHSTVYKYMLPVSTVWMQHRLRACSTRGFAELAENVRDFICQLLVLSNLSELATFSQVVVQWLYPSTKRRTYVY